MRILFFIVMAIAGFVIRPLFGWEGVLICMTGYLLGVWGRSLSK